LLSDVLQARIREYAPANAIEQENVLAELMQHYVLASLSRSALFSAAMFHGGTCLRICHGMNRFSEDLDFLLKQADPEFAWEPHLRRIAEDCAAEGLSVEIQDKNRAVGAVRKAFVKTDSIGSIVTLDLPFERFSLKKIRIRLEIDINPPRGSSFETSYLSFPTTAPITTQTLSSGFGTKTHALLCRRYVKGRDWYDFLWYVARRTIPDLPLLGNALFQQGPWQGERFEVSSEWLLRTMRERIESIDWNLARDDVQRFLPLDEQRGLDSWSADLFLHQVERMAAYLPA
jgi:predicted nucleotidyltransferase component of viral defense system